VTIPSAAYAVIPGVQTGSMVPTFTVPARAVVTVAHRDLNSDPALVSGWGQYGGKRKVTGTTTLNTVPYVARVYLYPQDAPTLCIGMVVSDATDGAFTFSNIRDGNYIAVAIDSDRHLRRSDPRTGDDRRSMTVNLDFYRVPQTGALNLDFGQRRIVFPVGIASAAFGSPTMQWVIRFTGFPTDEYGSTVISSGASIINNVGWLDEAFGTATITMFLLPSGWTEDAVGSHVLSKRNTVTPSGMFDEAFGTPAISPITIAAPSGFDEAYGTARFDRTLPTNGFSDLAFGTPDVDLFTRYLLPLGFTHGSFGFPLDGVGKIEYLNRTLAPSGIVATAFGSTSPLAASALSIRPVAAWGRRRSVPRSSPTASVTCSRPASSPGRCRRTRRSAPISTSRPPASTTPRSATPSRTDNTQHALPLGLHESAYGLPFVALNPQPIRPHRHLRRTACSRSAASAASKRATARATCGSRSISTTPTTSKRSVRRST
jgi:hypothetical protein